ncbi:hypothetical protein CFK38_01320 [Brachybacterium vulturis]|uniref:Uncharacterized protein n=1 Tax=Brachybacterium vulturis TaxID=2017484 RepID=A0A291GIF9_9MICO|nr:hypothetical protein CFK38_01320 [Brachybacterium vulturis]
MGSELLEAGTIGAERLTIGQHHCLRYHGNISETLRVEFAIEGDTHFRMRENSCNVQGVRAGRLTLKSLLDLPSCGLREATRDCSREPQAYG